VAEGLTAQGSLSYNDSKQTNTPCLTSNVPNAPAGTPPGPKDNPTPVGQCITQVNGQPYTNPYGVLGTAPAFSPKLQFNGRVRYDWNNGDFRPFVSVGANYTGTMRNQPASFPDGNSPTYNPPTTDLAEVLDARIHDGGCVPWRGERQLDAEFSVSNLTNNDASTNTSSAQFIKSEVPLRPR